MKHTDKNRINDAIRATELRVLSDDQGNLGIMTLHDALAKARELGLDLIEISPEAVPPVAKIIDYGKFQYSQSKKAKEVKIKTKSSVAASEIKSIQIKVGTGENDLAIKGAKASEWLASGHRVKIELFLRGRIKFMEKGFLQERLERILTTIATPHRVVDGPKDSPKGIVVTVEKVK